MDFVLNQNKKIEQINTKLFFSYFINSFFHLELFKRNFLKNNTKLQKCVQKF